jgi:acyl-CoA hydrolase
MFLRTWMSRLPKYLRLPWERGRPVRRQRSYIHKIEPVRQATLNIHGTAYGGTMMRWSEDAASLSARAYCEGAAMRCTGLHGLNFLRPVQRDRFMHIRSVVVHTAGSSLTVLVSVCSEDPVLGSEYENLRAFFTYAPLDAWTRLPGVEMEDDEERALFEEVELRLRLQRTLHGAR